MGKSRYYPCRSGYAPRPKQGNKYKACQVERHGIVFDSIKEANRYDVLLVKESLGEIKDLQRQVKYVLIPEQREPDTTTKRGKVKKGKLIERECSYIADFVYKVPALVESYKEDCFGTTGCTIGWETVVEDTKGFRTKDYIIKRKLMLLKYGIRIQEI